jgi:hypothetical protein
MPAFTLDFVAFFDAVCGPTLATPRPRGRTD